jgi:hypothetical protein
VVPVVSAERAIAGFDSASAMVRILGAALHGREAPLLAQFPAALEPQLDWLTRSAERLPKEPLQAIYRWSGWLDAVPARRLRQVRAEQLANWVVSHYPRRRYPVVFAGSSNGAMTHLAAALGAPWLPQTLLLAVRTGGLDPDDPATDMRAMTSVGQDLVAANPALELHHMHDPVQDRLMIARMAYFRVKFLRLPQTYRTFLAQCLEPGGTLVLVDCALRWPVTTVADRHLFQFGAPGGATQCEFFEGGPRVAGFLRQNGSDRDRWQPPEPDTVGPEAEWGFAEPLAADLTSAAAGLGRTVGRLRLDQPEDASPLIAGLFRHWYGERGLPTGRLLVSSFLIMDPVLTMRTGQVPYWALFGSRPSVDRLTDYLSATPPYDDIRLTVFPHGMDSIGLAGIGEWQQMLGHARRHGQLLAIEPDHYPRHFRALTGFHRELSKLPRIPAGPPLAWDAARQYLASHAPVHKVSFHIDHS